MAATAVSKKAWTERDLELLPQNGYKNELLDGKLIMSPVHANHGVICVRLSSLLFEFVQRRKLGQVYDSSTGFRLTERVLLSPDISFVSRATARRIFVGPDKFLFGAPDLAVEVISPIDRLKEVYRKLDLYFEHGVRLAWLVDWKKEQVHIYTSDSIAALTKSTDTLTGGEVLTGFKCRLGRIFGAA